MTVTPQAYDLAYLASKDFSLQDYITATGCTEQAAWSRRKRAKAKLTVDPAIARGMEFAGMVEKPDHGWLKTAKDKDGNSYSFHFKTDVADKASFAETLLNGLSEYTPPTFAPHVNHGAKGDHLLVVDLADIHFGKLCNPQETGSEYNIQEARHRVIEGTRALLGASKHIGVHRILFVMGNDILHTDNGKTTTSGTPQDTDGTFFQAFRAAQYASIDAIKECADVADVDLLHCMSNHDWRSGWGLSQTVAAHFKGHHGVRATDYNMSESHRKYYGFERNGFLLTHGNGAKEAAIAGLFLKEAKKLVSSCDHFYALLHHFHHKIAKRLDIDMFQSEKDHIGMTSIVSGSPKVWGEGVDIEYVRSPSAPDGWHNINAFVNRQGVECFAYHAYDGQRFRFTEWF